MSIFDPMFLANLVTTALTTGLLAGTHAQPRRQSQRLAALVTAPSVGPGATNWHVLSRHGGVRTHPVVAKAAGWRVCATRMSRTVLTYVSLGKEAPRNHSRWARMNLCRRR